MFKRIIQRSTLFRQPPRAFLSPYIAVKPFMTSLETLGGEAPVAKKPRLDLPESIPKIPKPATNIDHLKPIIWIDCEMTGLDTVNDHIIEICCIITDQDLNVVDETGYESVVHYDAEVMDKMGEWCIEHHGSSGLTDKVLKSDKSLEQVQSELLEYISKYVSRNKGILAGNSVHMDRIFMVREMPKVVNYLFYRIIDVSTIMEVGKRHNPELIEKCPHKKSAHTAKSDILESIEQLRWYRDNYLVQPVPKQEQDIGDKDVDPNGEPTV